MTVLSATITMTDIVYKVHVYLKAMYCTYTGYNGLEVGQILIELTSFFVIIQTQVSFRLKLHKHHHRHRRCHHHRNVVILNH